MPYNFGYYLADVDVPELDAFLGEMRKLCERHGIGFEWESGWGDESAKVLVVPADRSDLSFLFDSLADYAGGIPFLDEAKARAKQAYDDRQRRDRQYSEQRAAAARAEEEERLKLNGIKLSDGAYKLVKIDRTQSST